MSGTPNPTMEKFARISLRIGQIAVVLNFVAFIGLLFCSFMPQEAEAEIRTKSTAILLLSFLPGSIAFLASLIGIVLGGAASVLNPRGPRAGVWGLALCFLAIVIFGVMASNFERIMQ